MVQKSRKKTTNKKKPATRKAKTKTAKPVRKRIVKPARKKLAKAVRKQIVKPARKKIEKPARKAVASKSARKARPVNRGMIAKPSIGGMPDELYKAALRVLEDRQAEEVISFNLAGRSAMADYLIIASGRASRQIAAIADYLREAFIKLGARHIRVEGLPEANWVLVDAGDVVVHLFRPEVRRYYRLEDIWSGSNEQSRKS